MRCTRSRISGVVCCETVDRISVRSKTLDTFSFHSLPTCNFIDFTQPTQPDLASWRVH
jgi:hypothetical protein